MEAEYVAVQKRKAPFVINDKNRAFSFGKSLKNAYVLDLL